MSVQQLTDEQLIDNHHVLGWVEWDDGARRPIVGEMLDDLEFGYAITVHKAQNSQWPRLIVPVARSRLFDRTLLYTAITRAQRQAILVGDEAAALAAVERFPRAQTRQVALQRTLASLQNPRVVQSRWAFAPALRPEVGPEIMLLLCALPLLNTTK